MNNLRLVFVFLALGIAVPAIAQETSDFTGTWVLNAKKGENLGMVAAIQETLSITQTAEKITIDSAATFQGKTTERQVNYDLAGAPVVNFAAMGDRSETVSQWEDGGLVTIWTSEGAIAGTEVVRTETRKLAGDGMTMTIRTARGDTPAMVRVYEKQE